ncbi:S41 family peptidase [Magnetovibrio sp. PR-2]|uniref:S41 family peptidase n=1 Tax=Magnetovibrio sp. PR-2 TaxID=3120356 RepID=UPI002FCE58C2
MVLSIAKPSGSFGSVGAGILLALTLAACAPEQAATTLETTKPTEAQIQAQETRHNAILRTIRAGLSGIQQRYIEPVYTDALALGAVQGLATIDPTFTVSEFDSAVHLHKADNIIASHPRPLSKSPDDWTALIVAMVEAAQKHSDEFENIDNERVFEAVFDGMLSGLDIYSRYAGADEARANRARRDGFGGIDIRFANFQGDITITQVQDGGPADTAGIKKGDVILSVNGHKTPGLSVHKVARLLRGPVDSHLTVHVKRINELPDLPERTIGFRVKRAHVVRQTVKAKTEDDVLFLSVTGFNKKTAKTMRTILKWNEDAIENNALSGIVIDLRGNPGGLLSQSVDVADLFLRDGRIIATRGRHPDSFHDYRAEGRDVAEGTPLVVLIDGGSASAAELVAGALQDLGRAVVVGSTSYGKGTVQTVLRLPNDGEITLTWSRLVTPSGYAIHGLGVQPSICSNRPTPYVKAPHLANQTRIDQQRAVMVSWRKAGLAFDGRRAKLRESCPAKTFSTGASEDIWKGIAKTILNDPELYHYALSPSNTSNTAERF